MATTTFKYQTTDEEGWEGVECRKGRTQRSKRPRGGRSGRLRGEDRGLRYNRMVGQRKECETSRRMNKKEVGRREAGTFGRGRRHLGGEFKWIKVLTAL
jgi:hypothetical protein